uniref:Uncharacterized protein n=1 Tax=Fagus sylvatica TaxID=28930 RepID=A0A2N9IIW0_FAGSY
MKLILKFETGFITISNELYRELACLKGMLDCWVEKVLSGATKASMIHPQLPLPCSLQFFVMVTCRNCTNFHGR